MAQTHTDPRAASTGDLVRRLLDSVQALVDKQIELIKQELREDLGQVAGAAKTLGIGVGLLITGALSLLIGLFLTIEHFTGFGWLVALAVAVLLMIVGAVVAKKGIGQVKVQPLARTRETLKEDAEWARHRLTPNGRSNPSETTSQQP